MLKICLAVLFVVLSCPAAQEKELTEDEQKLVAAMDAYAERWLPLMRAAIKNSEQDRAAIIRSSMREIQKPVFVPTYFAWDLKPGHIGMVVSGLGSSEVGGPPCSYRVAQIIDKTNMIVHNHDARRNSQFDNLAEHLMPAEVSLWVSGIDTSELRDDQFVPLQFIFECVGNETYGTAIGGSNTIMKIEKFSVQSLDELKKKVPNKKRK